MAILATLPGYARVRMKGVRGLAVQPCHASVVSILERETLYAYAARQPDARKLEGRAPVYAIPIPQCGDVVVRHAMRGGALARSGSDLFFPPTRGLRELINSLRLRVAGVATPEIVAFITYRAGPLLRRSDVVTREIRNGHDLSVVLAELEPGSQREACLAAAGKLLLSLTTAGAHHPDLNIRNVLITWDERDGAQAHVLDVDRIRFHVPGDPMIAEANLGRIERSMRKWRDTGRLAISDDDLRTLRAASSVTTG